MYLENQESVREKSGKSQGNSFVKVCGNPASVISVFFLVGVGFDLIAKLQVSFWTKLKKILNIYFNMCFINH